MSNSRSNSGQGKPLWIKVLIGILVLVALVPLGLWMWGRVARSGWNAYAAELRAEGEPLTFEEINALRPPIPDADNGARIIHNLTDELSALAESATGQPIMLLGDTGRVSFFDGIPRHQIEPTRSFRDKHAAVLVPLEALRGTPRGRIVRDWNRPVMDLIIPDMGPVRTAAKMIAVDAYLDLIDGDLESASESVGLLWNLAGTVESDPLLIAALVGIAIDAMAIDVPRSILRVGEVPDAVLVEWSSMLNEQARRHRMRWALRGERAALITTMEDLSAGRPVSAGTTGSQKLSGVPVINAVVRMNQRKGCEMLTSLIDVSENPAALFRRAEEMDAEVESLSLVQVLTSILTPSLAPAARLNARIHAELRCARVALAAERFRLATGALPDSIDALVPEYLDSIPIDPFDEQPIKLGVTENGITVYSVYKKEKYWAKQTDIDPTEPQSNARFRLYRPDRRGLVILDKAPNE